MNFETENNLLYETSIIDSSLSSTNKAAKALTDVDISALSGSIRDTDKSFNDRLKDLNDNGIDRTKKSLKGINDTLKYYTLDTRSIIARARNSVLQFPIYVTQSIRISEAQIISKLFERVYTTYVQTVLSQNQILDEEEANNLVFLKKYHSNLKESADINLINEYYEPIDDFDKMMVESILHSEQLNENCTVQFRVIPCTDKDLILENSRLMNEPLSGLTYLLEANGKDEEINTTTKNKYVILSDSDLEDMAAERADISTEDKKNAKKSLSDIKKDAKEYTTTPNYELKTDEDKDAYIQKKIDEYNDTRKKLDAAVDKVKKDIKDGKIKSYSYKDGRYIRLDKSVDQSSKTKTSKEINTRAVDTPKLLKDSEIKKLNNMDPYAMEVSFRLRSKNGIQKDVKYVIGIKSVLHPINANDLAGDLQDLITGELKSLQKVRYKTGEIKFADYFFNIKGLKSDAAKHINYNKRWINTLKRLSDYKQMHGSVLKAPVEALNKGDSPIPNGTLILSQSDVTMLTNSTGIDLSKVANAKRLARNLFLIGIGIIDSSAGTMKVIFPDAQNDWDVQSLDSIAAELAKTENSKLMKELNKIVNK